MRYSRSHRNQEPRDRCLLICLLALSVITTSSALSAASDRVPPGSTDQTRGANETCVSGRPPVLYEFAGALNSTSAPEKATVIQCTNSGDAVVEIEVELWNYNAATSYCSGISVDPLKTATFESSQVPFYLADVFMNAGSVEQGLGQIRAGSTDVLCTVQVVDPSNDPPTWSFDLPLYRVSAP